MTHVSDLGRGERMLALFMHLLSHRNRRFDVSTLLEELNLDNSERRNLQRDLLALAGLPGSYVHKYGTGTRITWGVEVEQLGGLVLPGVDQALLSLIFMRRISGLYPELAEDIGNLVEQFQQQLPGRDKKLIADWGTELNSRILFMGESPDVQEEASKYIADFLRAIRERRKVNVLYQGNEDEAPCWHKRVPALLVVYQGEIYVGCYSQSNPDADYYLKLKRVRKTKLLGESYPNQPSRLNRFRARIVECGGMLGDNSPKAEKVRLKFPPYLENILKERRYHPTAKLSSCRDGSIELAMKVEVNRSLMQWVLGWAERVEVLEPAALRKQLREFGKELFQQYST